MGAPLVVLRGADGSSGRIIQQYMRRSLILAPHNVVVRVDGPVVVVIAGDTGGINAQNAGRVELRGVPGEAGGEGWQFEQREGAADGRPIEEIERLTSSWREPVNQRHLQGTVKRECARRLDLIVAAARRRAAEFHDECASRR